MKISFANKLSLLRVGLPEIRIQRLCPWNFPDEAGQRTRQVQAINIRVISDAAIPRTFPAASGT